MASAHLLTITGTITFRERIALPPGALATIKLVDADGEVLAGTAIEAAGVPVEFALSADPAFIENPEELFIWAALRSEVGVWGTPDLVSADGDAVEVLLTKIED